MYSFFSYQLAIIRLLALSPSNASTHYVIYLQEPLGAKEKVIDSVFYGATFDLYGLHQMLSDRMTRPGAHLLTIEGALFDNNQTSLRVFPSRLRRVGTVSSLLRLNRFPIDYIPTRYHTPLTVAFIKSENAPVSALPEAEVKIFFNRSGRNPLTFRLPARAEGDLYVFEYDPRDLLADFPTVSVREEWRARFTFDGKDHNSDAEFFQTPRRNVLKLQCSRPPKEERTLYYRDNFNLPAYFLLQSVTRVEQPKFTNALIGGERKTVLMEAGETFEAETYELSQEEANEFLSLVSSKEIRLESPEGERICITDCELKEQTYRAARVIGKITFTAALDTPKAGEGEPRDLYNRPFAKTFD